MSKILKVLFGDPNKKLLNELQKEVEKINGFESTIQLLSDDALKAKTQEFKTKLSQGVLLDELLHEAFAVVREAARRTLGQRHYDVQLIGGLVLHRGQIAEMRTGEGKTLTSTLALYTNALRGQGCHLVTVNDYLARRDAVWMGQVFHFLGLSVACIQQDGGLLYDPSFKHKEGTEVEQKADEERDETGSFHVREDYLRPCSRLEAYAADITYGTNNQFGFDYLRDNMAPTLGQCVMRELHYAIVDEIDSILIDEARTPLIISAPDEKARYKTENSPLKEKSMDKVLEILDEMMKKNIVNIKTPKTSKQIPEVLSREEIKKLIDAAPTSKTRLIIKLLYSTGLRVSELVNLKVKDLELEHNYGWVRQGKGRKDRLFILPLFLKEKLIKWIEEQKLSIDSWLFPGLCADHYSVSSIQAIVKQAKKVIIENLYQEEIPIPFKEDLQLKKSGKDDMFSDEIQEIGKLGKALGFGRAEFQNFNKVYTGQDLNNFYDKYIKKI